MNKNVAKALIFMAGSAFGAIISAFATKKVVEKVYWDECDKELNEQNLRHKEELKAYKDKIEELESTISQQNVAIAVLGKKVSEESDEKRLEEAKMSLKTRIMSENGPNIGGKVRSLKTFLTKMRSNLPKKEKKS